MAGRIIGTRLPCCPGKDSRFTLRHNPDQPGQPWWVYYTPPSDDPVPADEPHTELVELVNTMKREMAQTEGGGPFSINEHSQIIARAQAPAGEGNAIHIVNVARDGAVSTYSTPITFRDGQLDPRAKPDAGEAWPGPLSGMTYKFAAPGNPKPPSRNLDEIFVEEEGVVLEISIHASITPYPPADGPLSEFLRALRARLPEGGRFRVNEHGRAFTSRDFVYIGSIPRDHWFRPLTARS